MSLGLIRLQRIHTGKAVLKCFICGKHLNQSLHPTRQQENPAIRRMCLGDQTFQALLLTKLLVSAFTVCRTSSTCLLLVTLNPRLNSPEAENHKVRISQFVRFHVLS